jgi:predicted AAA+ superfamily ATPase
MNPQKLLNYLLQNLETSTNVLILWDILKLLRSKNTKVVLYVYDSFLFDVDETEKDTLKQIIDIFNKHNLKVKFKKGTTYNFN